MQDDHNVFSMIFRDEDGRRWLVDTDGRAFLVANDTGFVGNEPCYVRDLQGNWLNNAAACYQKTNRQADRTRRALERHFQALLRGWHQHLNN